MTMGDEGGSSGSDSEPSADNLDEDEMAKIFPKKEVKKIPKKEEKKPLPIKKPIVTIINKKYLFILQINYKTYLLIVLAAIFFK
jgi:hypothetical protein